MCIVHLIRHARPAVEGLLLGRTDVPVAALPPPATLTAATIFSSPLRRALQTAWALFPNQDIIVLDELAEISHGEWDGLAWTEIERRDPELAARKAAAWDSIAAPGGETLEDVRHRAADAIARIRRHELPAAVVAHAGINAVLASQLSGEPVISFLQHYLEVKSYALS